MVVIDHDCDNNGSINEQSNGGIIEFTTDGTGNTIAKCRGCDKEFKNFVKNLYNLKSNSQIELRKFLVAMDRKINDRDGQYRDTWKTMHIGKLIDKLNEEILEYVEGAMKHHLADVDELVDIANVAMMVWYRLKFKNELKKKGKNNVR